MDSRNSQIMGDAGIKLATETVAPPKAESEKLSVAEKQEQLESVKKALENPEYDWRTIDGVSAQTGLDPKVVNGLLREMSSLVIKSSVPDEKGRALFTTRDHYRKHRSTWNRILTAVSDVVK